MGIFRDMAGIAAGAAGISARKAKAKKVLDEHRQRAQEELSIHEAEFKEYIASERTRYPFSEGALYCDLYVYPDDAGEHNGPA